MAKICETCGKTTVLGHSQKHRRGVAGKRWMNRVPPTPRYFRANIQKISVDERGKKVQKQLCAKCIKRIKFDREREFASL